MTEFVDVRLDRLSAVASLGLPAVQSRRDELTAAWSRDCDDPSPWVRGEAAWNLAAFFLAEASWSELAAMLRDSRAVVWFQAVQALREVPRPPRDPPDAILAALRERVSRSAEHDARDAEVMAVLNPWEFVAHGPDDLLSGDPARQARWQRAATHYLRLLPDDQRARLVPLLADPGKVGQDMAGAVGELGHEEGLGPLTQEALHRLLETAAASTAQAVLQQLKYHRTRFEPLLFEGFDRWIADGSTREAALELLIHQASLGAELGALVPALGGALRGPEGDRAAVALGTMLRHTESEAVLHELTGALLGGSAAAGTALLGRSSGWDRLTPLEPALRELLARESGSERLRGVLARVLVRLACRRPLGPREWLFHPDPVVVSNACLEAGWLSAEPWFDRLVALAPTTWSAARWLARWAKRSPSDARRVLAALPTAPTGARDDWRELQRRVSKA